MKTSWIVVVAVASILVVRSIDPAGAWDRGKVDIFAVLPPGSTGPEGLTVGPDGNVFVTTFGFNSQGPVTGNSELFVFRPNGSLLREVPIQNSTSHTLG